MRALTRSLALVLPCVLSATLTAAAADPVVSRASVTEALSSFEHEPQVNAVQAWGVEGERLLIEISRDPLVLPFVRARATALLRTRTGSTAAQTTLRLLVADPQAPLSVRRAAMSALISGFQDIQTVAHWLTNGDVWMRDGAVWSLSLSDLPAARTLLQSALSQEREAAIRNTITTALVRMDARLRAPATRPNTAVFRSRGYR